ncbi:MAG: hypothetical protein CL578_08135 [Alteromonadaceae bacterium]|uniref:hypothetical protein n=1 Tax=Paraglaciecola chathamensis TaxID=368405 RepID=UPI000C4D25C3|nr:hypothetical protein [Paraglaciecola agarilytica]MBN25004.1 hypothetical protein [Alteromonadaceae bacterium]|tara:strand:- start:15429 stop:15758 length:330 start_codon:yes stop_codon:yes gene_type:complete
MTSYEIFSTLIAILAVVISSVSLVRTRKLAIKQNESSEKSIRVSALTALLSEYKSQVKVFEKALMDGTVERENLSDSGMEEAAEKYREKQYQTLQKIEQELNGLKGNET